MKVYRIASRPACPLRVQMSDDEVVAALQFRDEQDVPFYWLLISPQLARAIIAEHQMTVVFHLPDAASGAIDAPDDSIGCPRN